MGRRAAYQPLGVWLNGRRVGTLTRAATGATTFQYDNDWLAWEHTMPVSLSMPLRESRYAGESVRAVFENLLPDNPALLGKVASRVGAHSTDAFDLLSVIGRDCVGALQFLVDDTQVGPVGEIDGIPVSDTQIAALLRSLGRAPLGMGESTDFRISIAGAQEKTALLWHENQWMKPLGTTATTHILKPQIGQISNGLDLSLSVENEHFCLCLMRELGFPVADTRIEQFEGEVVLIVKRFDRIHTREGRLLRRPQEDFCQALGVPPALKYNSEGGPGIGECLRLLQTSDEPTSDVDLFMKAQIAFWLIGATDGHAKNFSVFLSPGGRFRMTPLYDVISAEPSFVENKINRKAMKLAMAAGNKGHYRLDKILPRHFIQTARNNGISEARAGALMNDLADSWPSAYERACNAMPSGFQQQISDAIQTAANRRRKQIAGSIKVA